MVVTRFTGVRGDPRSPQASAEPWRKRGGVVPRMHRTLFQIHVLDIRRANPQLTPHPHHPGDYLPVVGIIGYVLRH